VRGHITVPEDKKAPLGLSLYIVPAEKDKSEDVLRFFTTAIADDGTFGLNNLPPGHYWAIVRFPSAEESHLDWKLRLPDQAQNRVNLRRAAEAAKIDIELKPCQNLTDYQLPLNLSASK